MPDHLPPLRLTGAKTLIDGQLADSCVCIAGGVIASSGGAEVDLSGYLILPGIIDLHGDGFEHHIRPRPTAAFPVSAGIASYDREAAAQGVTTLWLAQGWSWEGGHRGPEMAEAVLQAVADHRPLALTDQRVQLRVETHFVEAVPRLLQVAEHFGLDYAIFNDHLDEGEQMRRVQPEAFSLWARKLGLAGHELEARLAAAKAGARAVPRSLCTLAQGFDRLGIRFGSHDDPNAETREFYSMIGARIAEFPLNRRAAAAARAMGDPILMGAPNVVRGGSQSGNIAAVDLIREGLCDALVSDYHLPALPLAAWRLADLGLCNLARAWEMISAAPARIMGLSDRGRIAPGQRADLVIMNPETRTICATFCGGRLAFASGEVALRLMGKHAEMRLAAE